MGRQKPVRCERRSLPYITSHALLTMTAPPSLSGSRQVDNELAERASLRLHVSVTIAGDIASPTIVIADHHSRFNLLSKLLFSISNKLIDRPSVFSGPAVIFFLPLCIA